VIPYGRQSIDDADIEAVVAVLHGDWLTQGPFVEEFETALADVTGARFAVAFSNGTAALHAACASAGLGPGDRVVTTPLSFVASANCARYVGATVGFCDIDPDTLNLDPAQLDDRADALVAVHFAGLPLDLEAVAHRPRIVIEDAAHAVGALTPHGPVGNCAHSDMCCFSFHPVKNVTTAEGGAVTTNSAELARRLREFRSHGMVKHPERGGWFYDVESLGFNYRLTDLQAALGTSQLRKLEVFVTRRNELAARYHRLLAGVPGLVLPPEARDGWRHGRHLFTVQVPALARPRVYDGLYERGVGTQVHYRPIHLHSTMAELGYGRGSFPHAELAGEQLLSLPLFPALSEPEQDHVVSALTAVLGEIAHAA
jgi:UDP-4-amino-4,6-dideoxy-N-acetyl-beta-L-altrosamine transaminase